MNPAWYRWDGQDLLLQLRIQPRASQDEFAEVQDAWLRARITAPPVDGKANAHLTAWLARMFKVGKGAVTIEQGLSGRNKRIRITAPRLLPAELDIAPPKHL